MSNLNILSAILELPDRQALALGKGPHIPLGAPHDIVLETEPMDDAWKTRFDTEAEIQAPPEPQTKALQQRLIDGLIAFGGERANVATHDQDMKSIIARGFLLEGRRAKKVKGKPCQCHGNVAVLWNANRDRILIMTGYALSQDGMWRQHSWAIEIRTRSRSIIETTVKRVAYFGFVMTEAESVQFKNNNP